MTPADAGGGVALRVVLLSPVYRGRITAAAADALVKVRAHVVLQAAAAAAGGGAGGRVAITATITTTGGGGGGAVVSTCKAGPFGLGAESRQRLAAGVDLAFSGIDARTSLRPRRLYTLQVALVNVSSAAPVATQRFNLTRFDDATSQRRPAVSIDSTKRTLVNGRPFFPVGAGVVCPGLLSLDTSSSPCVLPPDGLVSRLCVLGMVSRLCLLTAWCPGFVSCLGKSLHHRSAGITTASRRPRRWRTFRARRSTR
eukprot:SAG22_NODE_1066_length_5744_cov_7.937290_2_plen_255_part_00